MASAPGEEMALATLAKIRQLARQHPVVYLPAHDSGAARRLAARDTVKSANAMT
jgi:glyoxylase-like metal-dependent hydrolase (beta-lactamase superfamily II)